MSEFAIGVATIILAAFVASTLHELTHYIVAAAVGRNPQFLPYEWAVAWETVGSTGAVIRRADWAIAIAPAVIGVPAGVVLWWLFGAPLWTLGGMVALGGVLAALGRLRVPAWVCEYGFGPLTILATMALAAATTLPYWVAFAWLFYALYGLVTNDIRFEINDEGEGWALGPEELDRVQRSERS